MIRNFGISSTTPGTAITATIVAKTSAAPTEAQPGERVAGQAVEEDAHEGDAERDDRRVREPQREVLAVEEVRGNAAAVAGRRD